ncbi:MAG: hypothetical protein CL908_18810 [Deltaproteobacteria bacterium]|nr:hypothetical protein [Deltaproteobacteria bacterium]
MSRRFIALALVLVSVAASAQSADQKAGLLRPDRITENGPHYYRVLFETTKGKIVIEVKRSWSPRGADRFYHLVRLGFYDDTAFFRVLNGFMAQFGLNGDPKVSQAWQGAQINDDEVTQSNTKGMLSFAKSSLPNSRTTQVFINYANNSRLDGMGFSPFGRVVEGMDVAMKLYNGYGEGAPSGRGPAQGRIQQEGNAYLKRDFPKLDRIKKATILKGVAGMPGAAQKQITNAKARLAALYKMLIIYHTDHKRWPKERGPEFLLAVWKAKILDHTEKDASLFFCPSTGNVPGEDLANVTAEGIDWAGPIGRARLSPATRNANEIVIAAHKVRGGDAKAPLGGRGICVLTAAGSVDFIPASAFKNGKIVIGPRSSIKKLRRLSMK